MSIFDKTKEGIKQAKNSEFFDTVKGSIGSISKKSLKLLSEEKLADLVIMAANKQEKVNKILKQRESNYRIGNIDIGVSLPPTIVFGIRRIADEETVSKEIQLANDSSDE
ncbi:MAG: hypothetical protein JRH15_14250 [Deltaproteobacteria bacterium]|nr:hypothetical protein [Deltaproteobacteria bacterium]